MQAEHSLVRGPLAVLTHNIASPAHRITGTVATSHVAENRHAAIDCGPSNGTHPCAKFCFGSAWHSTLWALL
jgi:hypothetical protein